MSAISFAATEIHKQIGAFFNPKLTLEMKEVQKAAARGRLQSLNRMWDGKDYVMSDRFKVADAYLFTVLNRTHLHSLLLDSYPRIHGYKQRIAAREK